MKNEKRILEKVIDAFDSVIKQFKQAPYSFYCEQDIHNLMFAELSKIKYLSKRTYKNGKWNDCLLHSQTLKYKRKGKKRKDPEGKFDIVIFDDDFSNEDVFAAIEIKSDNGFNNKKIRQDINNLTYSKNDIKYAFMFSFNHLDNLNKEKKYAKKLELNLNKEMFRKKIGGNLFFFFVFVEWKTFKFEKIVYEIKRDNDDKIKLEIKKDIKKYLGLK